MVYWKASWRVRQFFCWLTVSPPQFCHNFAKN